MAQGNRMDRVSGLVQSALAEVLLRDIEGERFRMVTITSVSLSRDFSNAKVFVSVWDDTQIHEVVAELNVHSRQLRYALAQTGIRIRVIPQLRFIFDDSIVRGSRISSLLNTALKNKNSESEE
jgi:ribosome-binding factor A